MVCFKKLRARFIQEKFIQIMKALVIFVMINIMMPFVVGENISLIISMFFCVFDAYEFMEMWRKNLRLTITIYRFIKIWLKSIYRKQKIKRKAKMIMRDCVWRFLLECLFDYLSECILILVSLMLL